MDLHAIIKQKKLKYRRILNRKFKFIENEYKLYNQVAKGKRIKPKKVDITGQKSLISLYDSKTDLASEICREIVNAIPEELYGKCVNCFIGESSELDHFLPKEFFPYFSIFHLNLVPICGTCNKKKGKSIPLKGNDFIHPYFDFIPDIQYLKCNIIFRNNVAKAVFSINKNVLGYLEKRMIDHYENLDLLDRFQKKSAQYFSRIATYKNYKGQNYILKILKKDREEAIIFYGTNSWKAVLCTEMLRVNFLKKIP
ncbi:hypothetical protein LEP1GSC192_1180 [Leptospira sp. B5-022]|nr:hypothetical protein LEP1GSC192_1180 [Leptospira sp. B5-022]